MPANGLGARMKQRIAMELREMGARSGIENVREDVQRWFESNAKSSTRVIGAAWEIERSAREFIAGLPKLGVVPGRPFPPLENMLRVTIGTDVEMAKFRDAFWKVYKG